MSLEHSQHCHCVCTDLSPLQEAIERVRALHVKEEKDGDAFCTACVHHEEFNWWQMWPCDTIKALNGDTV